VEEESEGVDGGEKEGGDAPVDVVLFDAHKQREDLNGCGVRIQRAGSMRTSNACTYMAAGSKPNVQAALPQRSHRGGADGFGAGPRLRTARRSGRAQHPSACGGRASSVA